MNTLPLPNMADPRPNILRIILLILAIAIVITTIALIILNVLANREKSIAPPGQKNATAKTYDDGYRDGYKAAREKLSGQFGMPLTEEIKIVSGAVQSVSGNRLQILVRGLNTDEFVDGVSDSRTVMIGPNTQILIRTALSPEEEATALQEALKSSGEKPPILPTPFKETVGSATDIREGMDITIYAEKNIRLESEFDASKIYIQGSDRR